MLWVFGPAVNKNHALRTLNYLLQLPSSANIRKFVLSTVKETDMTLTPFPPYNRPDDNCNS